MNIFDKNKAFVLGLAQSGRAVCALLAANGFAVKAWDDDERALDAFMSSKEMEGIVGALEPVAEGKCQSALEGSDFLVVSPGVPLDHALVARALSLHMDVVGELEVAYQFSSSRIVGVTGTNGKSTVTDLIGSILHTAGIDAIVAGNIGIPFSAVVSGGKTVDTVVLEVSSFQLDTIDRFRADIAVLLNITPDHLDRYNNSFERYAASKKKILNRADSSSFYIYNHEDIVCSSFTSDFPGTSVPFSSTQVLDNGAYHYEDRLVRCWEEQEIIIPRRDFTPIGIHNLENALAAIAAVTPMHIEREAIAEALKNYRALPHRMELVQVARGVAYINDSKATNVDACAKSLQSIEGKVVLILGGKDKNGDFTTLYPHLGNVKIAILIGDAKEKIKSTLQGRCHMQEATSMQEAVSMAGASAEPGDSVLLAPACASFDMFSNYKERGEVFRACVKDLQA